MAGYGEMLGPWEGICTGSPIREPNPPSLPGPGVWSRLQQSLPSLIDKETEAGGEVEALQHPVSQNRKHPPLWPSSPQPTKPLPYGDKPTGPHRWESQPRCHEEWLSLKAGLVSPTQHPSQRGLLCPQGLHRGLSTALRVWGWPCVRERVTSWLY